MHHFVTFSFVCMSVCVFTSFPCFLFFFLIRVGYLRVWYEIISNRVEQTWHTQTSFIISDTKYAAVFFASKLLYTDTGRSGVIL